MAAFAREEQLDPPGRRSAFRPLTTQCRKSGVRTGGTTRPAGAGSAFHPPTTQGRMGRNGGVCPGGTTQSAGAAERVPSADDAVQEERRTHGRNDSARRGGERVPSADDAGQDG